MDGYGKLIGDGPSSDGYGPSQPTVAFNPSAPGQPQPGPYNGQVGFNVPLQVGYGGYNQNVNVPVAFAADGYGPAGQFVSAQMQQGVAGHLPKGRWSDSIFDCTSSISICLITVICPCIQFGLIVRRAFPERGFLKPAGLFLIMYAVFYVGWILGGWFTNEYLLIISGIAFCPLVGLLAWNRNNLRAKYDITGIIIWDFVLNWFCWPCALCQEARHVERDVAMPV